MTFLLLLVKIDVHIINNALIPSFMEVQTYYKCPSCKASNLVLAENPVSLMLYCPHCSIHVSFDKKDIVRNYVDYERHEFKWKEAINDIYHSIVAAMH